LIKKALSKAKPYLKLPSLPVHRTDGQMSSLCPSRVSLPGIDPRTGCHINEIKSNLQTLFKSFAKFVDKFSFIFEVSNLKKNIERRTVETLTRFENCLACR
jgi:hypothetical protein